MLISGVCIGEESFEWRMKSGNTGWTGYSSDSRIKPPFRLKWATQPGFNLSWGVCMSVAEGKVFLREGCLDAETGEVIWKRRMGRNTPTYCKGRLYGVGGGSRIEAYDAATGKRLWTKGGYLTSRASKSAVTACNGAVYSGRLGEHNGERFYFAVALDAVNGEELWAIPLVPAVGKRSGGYELKVSMSAAAVGGGRVIIVTHKPRIVFALDQKTGEELWRQEGVWARHAPSTDGQTVWVAECTQGVWALDAATGKKLWHWGGVKMTEQEAHYQWIGTADHAPTAAFGKLFVSCYGRNFTAIEGKTGKELWVAGDRSGREVNMWAGGCGPPTAAGGFIYSNGMVGKDFNGIRLQQVLYAIDPENGKPVWRYPLSSKSCARVAIALGRLYISTCNEIYCFEPVPSDCKTPEPQAAPYQPAGPLTALAKPFGGKPGTPEAGGKPEGGKDWPMYGGCPARCGLDVKIGLPVKEAWKFQTGGRVKSSPVIAGSLVFAGSDSGKLFALDLSTGKEKWSAEITIDEKNPLKVKWIRSAPAVADGIVVCGADDGIMRAFDAKTGKPKWQFRTAGRIRSSAAIVNGRAAPDEAKASSSVERRVVFGSWDGHCYCVRLSDGKEYWRYRIGEPGVRVHSPSAVAAGRVYVGAWEDYAVHGLDLGTGKPLGGYDPGKPRPRVKHSKHNLVHGIAVYRGLVVTAKRSGAGLMLDPTSGKVLGHISGRGGELPSLPAFSGNRVYYPTSKDATKLSEIMAKGKSRSKVRRKMLFKYPVLNALLISGDLMIAANGRGTVEVYRLPDATGDGSAKLIWEWKSPTSAAIQTAPAAADGFIVVGSDDGNVYTFSFRKKN